MQAASCRHACAALWGLVAAGPAAVELALPLLLLLPEVWVLLLHTCGCAG